MTKQEASERYGIPEKILDEYESWGLYTAEKKMMDAWQYDESDMERLRLILTLHDIGFQHRCPTAARAGQKAARYAGRDTLP